MLIVAWCSNAKVNDVSLHILLSMCKPHLRAKWVRFAGQQRPSRNWLNQLTVMTSVTCSKHFKADDYEGAAIWLGAAGVAKFDRSCNA